MAASSMVSKEVLCNDLRLALHGKVDAQSLEASVLAMQRASSQHAVAGGIESAIFYARISLQVRGGKTFTGTAGALGFGDASIVGILFTDDVNRLYADTVAFQFNATALYFNINFFDASNSLLGHVQAGATAAATGLGAGMGSWA